MNSIAAKKKKWFSLCINSYLLIVVVVFLFVCVYGSMTACFCLVPMKNVLMRSTDNFIKHHVFFSFFVSFVIIYLRHVIGVLICRFVYNVDIIRFYNVDRILQIFPENLLLFLLFFFLGERETLKKKIEEQRPTPSTATQCAICLNDLERDRIISALDLNWHIDCFRCSVCDVQLSHWYFEKDGLLFCRDDYLQRFGDACQQCSAFISGPAMIVDEHKFHPECFCCGSCQQYIGDGDSYALVERSKLFW